MLVEASDKLNKRVVMDHWLKAQLNESHKLLDAMGVPDRETRQDYNTGTMKMEPKEFSLGVPERISWLRQHWSPTPKPE